MTNMKKVKNCFAGEAEKKAYVAACDNDFEARLEAVCDEVCAIEGLSLIGLSGPTCSGKTTTALKLRQELERRGVGTHAISMDDYFLGRALKEQPLTPDGSVDYESPEMMDLKLLGEHFRCGRNHFF